MKVKPVKEKKNVSYPKLAVLTAAVSLTAALSGCDILPGVGLEGDINIQESDSYFKCGTSGVMSSEVTLDGDMPVFESNSASACSGDSSNNSVCSDDSKSESSDTSSEVTIMSEVALGGEVPESNN